MKRRFTCNKKKQTITYSWTTISDIFYLVLNLYKYFLDGFIFPFITDLPFLIFNFEKLM